MRWPFIGVVLTLLAAIAVACGGGTTPPSEAPASDRTGISSETSPSPASSPAVTSTPTPLVTVAPALIATPTPESTPTPVPSQVPAPAATQAPTPTQAPPPAPTPLPPSALFTVDVESGPAPLTVKFESAPQGPKTTLAWDFGDGNTSAETFPIHRYSAAGSYTVQLKIFGLGGDASSVKPGLITVVAGAPVDLLISPFDPILAVEEDVLFTAIARDEFGNAVPATVAWSTNGEGGVIGGNGRFTAGTTAGTFAGVVEASFEADSGNSAKLVSSVSVTVAPGPLFRAVLRPEEIVIDMGASQPFEVNATDKFGNPIFDVRSSWSAAPEVGDISPNGVLGVTGTNAGLYLDAIKVELVEGANKAFASADVAIRPNSLAYIGVQPSLAVMRRAGTVQLNATGYDSYGNVIPQIEFEWKAGSGIVVDRSGKVSSGSVTPPGGLISSWHADGSAIDTVSGNNGVLHGGAVYAAGVYGKAFSFDGEDDFVEVPVSNFLNLTGDVTVHLWAKRAGFGGDELSMMVQKGASLILSKDMPSAFGLYFSKENILSVFYGRTGIGSYNLHGPRVTDSKFHHYAYVRTGTLNQLFMDGVLVDQDEFTATPEDTVGLPLTIGATRSDENFTGHIWHFAGIIDEVQVFGRGLSTAEIKDIYVATKPEGRYSVTVRAADESYDEQASATVTVLDLPFDTRSWAPATVSQGKAAKSILAEIEDGQRNDFATLAMRATVHDVSSGRFGTDPCNRSHSRVLCSDPRDIITRIHQFSDYGDQSSGFIFGPATPQVLIIDLGRIRELDSIGASFEWGRGVRKIDALGVFVSTNGTEFMPLAGSPVEAPESPTFFSLNTPVLARYVAYYFGRCPTYQCDGSRVFEVYATKTKR